MRPCETTLPHEQPSRVGGFECCPLSARSRDCEREPPTTAKTVRPDGLVHVDQHLNRSCHGQPTDRWVVGGRVRQPGDDIATCSKQAMSRGRGLRHDGKWLRLPTGEGLSGFGSHPERPPFPPLWLAPAPRQGGCHSTIHGGSRYSVPRNGLLPIGTGPRMEDGRGVGQELAWPGPVLHLVFTSRARNESKKYRGRRRLEPFYYHCWQWP